MLMFLFLFFMSQGISTGLGAPKQPEECMPAHCGHHGPIIRFPFWLKNYQPDHCGYPDPGFALSCSSTKKTLLQLPSSDMLWVRQINYTRQVILIYVDNCDILLQNLNLSAFPFNLNLYASPNYEKYCFSIFSCPSLIEEDFNYEISSRSSIPNHTDYAVSPYPSINRRLLSCRKMYAIPSVQSNAFSYCHMYKPEHFELSWSKPRCSDCESPEKYCRLSTNNSRGHGIECFDNPDPYTYHPTPTGTKLLEVTGPFLGLFLIVVMVLLYLVHRSNKLKKEDQVKVERFLEDYRALKPTRYTYAEIKKITDNFSEELGQGGYGTVYKGKLSNDVLVAAKILSNFKGNGDDFINEVGTIGTIHHVNVVRLVGYCADGYRRALVYEYLPNHSLEKFISSDQVKLSLGWGKLQDIALGIAKGIEYLHQGCDQRILHFDIKPNNILLDENFNPKISDFGLAKLCSKEQSVVSMTAARGTVGYIAPEVFSRNFGNVSHKSDVYSFGMLLLEIVGGRKNDDVTVQGNDEVYFPEWIYNRLNRGEENRMGIVEDGDAKIVRKLTVVGLWCIQWYPGDRPSMKVVVHMLEGDGEKLDMPPSPFSTTNPSTSRGNMAGRPFSSILEIISESE